MNQDQGSPTHWWAVFGPPVFALISIRVLDYLGVEFWWRVAVGTLVAIGTGLLVLRWR